MNDIIMHVNYGEVSYCRFGKNTIENICEMASRLGYNGIEFRGEPPYELSDMSYNSYIEEIGRCKNKYGLKTIVIAMNLKDSVDAKGEELDKLIQTVVGKAKKAYEICGTTVFNTLAKEIQSSLSTATIASYEFHGSNAATSEEWDDTISVYKKIGEQIAPYGLKFAFETHMNLIHDLPEMTRKLVDLIDCPAIGINMDFGNTVYFPNHLSLEDTIDLYGEKLFYVHLKNSISIPEINRRIPTSLAEGEINHRIYLKKLNQSGFNGPICIEAPRAGDRQWYAEHDYNYIKSVINSIK